VTSARPDRGTHFPPPASVLRRSLRRVLEEQALAAEALAPKPIHDLRVALRRCGSLAEGFSEIDNHKDWRQLRKAARRLQRGLAELRDVQVMATWVRRLALAKGSAGAALTALLHHDERRARQAARHALADFSRKRWKRWRRRLPERAERAAAGRSSFAALGLERLAEACELQHRWRGSHSRVACHRLRVGVKRFRYTAESFLPEQHAGWGRSLKRLQTWLGEAHDLDVLRARILQLGHEGALPRRALDSWLERIARARAERVERYRKAVLPKPRTGKRRERAPLLWDRWRAELELLARISRLASAEAARLQATAALPATEKAPGLPGTPHPLFSAP
jgi:CHAD domain-containing protein